MDAQSGAYRGVQRALARKYQLSRPVEQHSFAGAVSYLFGLGRRAVQRWPGRLRFDRSGRPARRSRHGPLPAKQSVDWRRLPQTAVRRSLQGLALLVCGRQLGAGQNSIDWGKLWFSRQFDTAAERPDFGADPGESNLGANTRLYADFNAGLLWYVILPNDGYFYAGGALHHINKPIISLADDASQRLYQKWSGMAGGFLPLTDNFGLLPAALWMSQGPATQINAGMNVRYSNNDYNELGFRAGLWARAANKLDRGMLIDALIFTTMFEFNRFTLGLSYDITISPLTRVNNSRGAFEVSLSYFAPEYRRVRTVCPTL